MKRILVKTLIGAAAVLVLLVIWIIADLNRSYKVDIRAFDADEVASLDTAMWRSYYSGQRVKLFGELGDLLESQFHFPFWRRQLVAFYAAKSAFVFKDGKSRGDYETALPDLKRFYGEIHDVSTTDFDVDRAAKLELEWWIVHRQREQHAANDLGNALAAGAAAIYNVPEGELAEYGDLRARAMEIRDTKAESGGVTEDDWQQIDYLLHGSWRSLHSVVNKK
jgi:hypothetical protein